MSTDIQSITHRFEVGGHQPATPNRTRFPAWPLATDQASSGGRGKRAGLDHTHEGLHRAESVHFPYVSTVEANDPTPQLIDAVDREPYKS